MTLAPPPPDRPQKGSSGEWKGFSEMAPGFRAGTAQCES